MIKKIKELHEINLLDIENVIFLLIEQKRNVYYNLNLKTLTKISSYFNCTYLYLKNKLNIMTKDKTLIITFNKNINIKDIIQYDENKKIYIFNYIDNNIKTKTLDDNNFIFLINILKNVLLTEYKKQILNKIQIIEKDTDPSIPF